MTADETVFKKIFVLGAGAVGSVIGGLLSKNGDVILVGNKAHMEAVSSKGLQVSDDVNETLSVQAGTRIWKIARETLILLTTNPYDSERAIWGIRGLLRPDTVILVLQNGLGNEELVEHAAGGEAKVLRGVTTMAAEFFRPGAVKYWKGETTIERDAAAEDLADVMNACGLKTCLSGNMREVVWGKAVVNSVVNPLTAIFQVRNDEICAQPLATVRHHIVRECVKVGEAEGVTLPRHLEKVIDKEIGGYTNYSSMCQDMMKGKRTEIDFLNGKMVELGRKHGVPTPVNETLVHLVKFMEEKNELSRKD